MKKTMYRVVEIINNKESYVDFDNEKDARKLFDDWDNFYAIKYGNEELEEDVDLFLLCYEFGNTEMAAIEGSRFLR